MRALVLATLAVLAGCGSGSSAVNDSDYDMQGTSVQDELRQFPGVEVWEANGTVQVRVRGLNSLMTNEEPLYVVDGQPVAPGPGGSLAGIARADIVDIRVLKSASETSVYGPRGAAGVVVITTRHGRR